MSELAEYSRLCAAIEKIKTLRSAVTTARYLPDSRAREVSLIELSLPGYNRTLSEHQKLVMKRVKDQAVTEERRAGEIARDRELARLAREILKARVEMAQAFEGAIHDLGDLAVALQAEAAGEKAEAA